MAHSKWCVGETSVPAGEVRWIEARDSSSWDNSVAVDIIVSQLPQGHTLFSISILIHFEHDGSLQAKYKLSVLF